jgi:hypothetical protein
VKVFLIRDPKPPRRYAWVAVKVLDDETNTVREVQGELLLLYDNDAIVDTGTEVLRGDAQTMRTIDRRFG